MLSLLVEGFGAAWLPCSLVLVVPGVATVLAGREYAGPAAAAYALGTALLSWLRFADIGGDFPLLVPAVALAVAAVLLVIPTSVPPGLAAVIGGGLAGGAAAELWEPCVGVEFGTLLNGLPDDGLGGLATLAVYLLGVLAPIGGVMALLRLLPPHLVDATAGALAVVGGAALAVMAIATAIGLHDDVVAQLFVWSL
ncbi:MAG: hypothetical protein AAF962_15685 [Actinomycetota bacterium]